MQYTCELYQNISVQWIKNILSHWFFFFLHCPFSPSVQHLRDLNADLVHGSLLSIKYSTLSTTLRGKYWTEIGLEFRHKQNCCLTFYILIIFHVFARTADTGVSSLHFSPLMIIFVIIVITKFFVFCSFYHQRWHITIAGMWLIRSSIGIGIRSQRN